MVMAMNAATNEHTDRAPERVPRWANTLLVAGIGAACAVVSIKALSTLPDASSATADIAALSSTSRSSADGLDIRVLADSVSNRHLFGEKGEAVVAAPVREEPVRETQLNLKLAGVFSYIPIERSIAIISVDNGNQETFPLGSRIVAC